MADRARDESWLVITVEAPSDAHKEALTKGLLALGGSAVQEDGPRLLTYVRSPASIPAFIALATASLRHVSSLDFLPIEWRREEGADWSQLWKRGLRARRVGRRFVVAPSWADTTARAGDLTIVIDPEMAFGTGEHATTRAALRFLEETVKAGDCVLDIGTGSAILAIAAAKLGAARVVAVENDPDALTNAAANLERNQAAGIVSLEQGTVDQAYLAATAAGAFDVIVANVLSSVLVPLLPALSAAVRSGGHVILGGILEHEAEDVLDAAEAAGFEVMTEDLEEEWWGVLLLRPTRHY